MSCRSVLLAALATLPLLPAAQAATPLTVGVILSLTGPAASLGIPEGNTVAMLPAEMAGVPVRYIVLDDATDPSVALTDFRKLISEDKVDVVIGSTVTPSTIAMTAVAAETGTPIITLAAATPLVTPVDDKRRWVFKTPQNDSMMAAAIVDHMAATGVKTLAFMGFSDPLGDSWSTEVGKLAEARGIRIVSSQRFGRADTSVVAQTLKIMAEKPDAVLVAAYGTPAALPEITLRDRGYTGPIYQTHGVANNDFLRVGGRQVEGTLLPVGPIVVAEQLPDGNASKKVAIDYTKAYEARYGAGSMSAFGAYAWDAGLVLGAALPAALKTAAPGTPAFRAGLRDALEEVKALPTTNGVVTMSRTDHLGLDERARVMVAISNGRWKLIN